MVSMQQRPLFFNLCWCRYCVVLLTGEGEKYAESHQAFLAFAVANTKETLRFVHIYGDHQQEFARTLLQGDVWSQAKSAVSVLPASSSSSSSWSAGQVAVGLPILGGHE